MRTLSLAILVLLSACGKEEGYSLNLILKLPATLSKTSGRYEHFLKKVEYMNIKATREGESREYRFPPSQWETLQISDLPKPGSQEKLEIVVEIWDRKEDGFRRTFPILKGQGSTKDQDLKVTLTAQANIL